MKKSTIVFDVLLIMIAVLAVTLGVCSYVAMSNKGKMTYIEICEKETWVSDQCTYYIEMQGDDAIVSTQEGKKFLLSKIIGDEYCYDFSEFELKNGEMNFIMGGFFFADLKQSDDEIVMKVTNGNGYYPDGTKIVFTVRDKVGESRVYDCIEDNIEGNTGDGSLDTSKDVNQLIGNFVWWYLC